MENKKILLDEELLERVSGGTGLEPAPEEALAEGLDYGVEVISDIGCDKCGCVRSRVVGFSAGVFVMTQCTGCNQYMMLVLRSGGGDGWHIA